MAAGKISYVKIQGMRGLTAFLTSAVCEWFLIILLLIGALLSYLLTKFAGFFGLQAPCILCSRLDFILGGEKTELYQTLLCGNHRSEITSLISCHIHNKVADGGGMCDDCLLSFTRTKAHSKTRRLMVGKLGEVYGDCSFQCSSKRDLFPGSSGLRPCTCCGKIWKPGHSSHRSFLLQPTGSATSNSCTPLPHVPRQSHLNICHDSESHGSVTSHCVGKNSCDSLSYVGFTELKLFSDSEFEFPFSDDDNDVAGVIHENNEAGSDPKCQCTSIISPKFPLSDSNPVEPNSSSPDTMPSLPDPCVKPSISKHRDVKFLDSDFVNDYGLGEVNWQQIDPKSSSSDLPKLISLHGALPSPIDLNMSHGESEKSKAVDVSQASDNGVRSIKNHEDGLMKITTSAGAFEETDLVENDFSHISLRHKNMCNTGKFSASVKEIEVSCFIKEQAIEEEVDEVKDKEELKLSSSQNSPQGSSLSLIIPSDDSYSPEMQPDASSSNGTKVIQRSASLDSGLGSMAGSNVSKIEEDSLVDQLKRQIAYDKKCMDSLHEELEEERNASAIAANQAMAMITKLQEEKAALHMEALQYLRMMEEQAEHDADALEKADDLLTEKEQVIQDLEAELEFYRLNLGEEPMDENMHRESSHLKAANMTLQNVGLPHITNNINSSCNSMITVASENTDEIAPSLAFKEEKLYISQCLKNLEKKFHQISCNETSSNKPNGRLEDSKSDEFSSGEGPQLNGHTETDKSVQKKFNISNGSLNDQDGSISSDNDDCSLRKENNHRTVAGPKNREVDLVALENEISELNDKLEALKADHDLLECILKTLQDRNNIQFIQEIACELHELRKFWIRSRW